MDWKQNKDNRYQFIIDCEKDTESVVKERVVNDNSIGSLFVLKSVYGYSESPQTVIIDNSAARQTPEQIALKYGTNPALDSMPVLDIDSE